MCNSPALEKIDNMIPRFIPGSDRARCALKYGTAILGVLGVAALIVALAYYSPKNCWDTTQHLWQDFTNSQPATCGASAFGAMIVTGVLFRMYHVRTLKKDLEACRGFLQEESRTALGGYAAELRGQYNAILTPSGEKEIDKTVAGGRLNVALTTPSNDGHESAQDPGAFSEVPPSVPSAPPFSR